ncbi:enoyl-CoA hydratase/isomerase family protein [Alkalimonas sp. MEB108]|uniref:Enoyl-CoA hydratase/isomerase family protein n=1 Tax=Alkalimonas cellulosilytica TaxID=3058395 RepID=A0ABU7J8N0_9GAMM|nr:enoyl-CoA hydratase/isomerase family protein [Alkalimonas sp. MEB108]MEE2002906.1 enoyl-CoA hydratase/isomerase family protein [Alkalimonas sp. MEB108]
MSTVKLSVDGAVATLCIDRAEKRNALNQAMWQQLSDHCDALQQDIKPKLVLVTAAGEQAFCAGADIQELHQLLEDSQALAANNQLVQQAQLKLQRLPCATIAVINGLCVGGGLGIALCCDFRLALQDARFAITPSKLGLLYSIEDSRRLVNLVGEARAKQLLYTGAMLDAETALKWGLVHQITERANLAACVRDWQQQLLAVSRVSITGIKQTIAHLGGDPEFGEAKVRPLFDAAFQQADFQQAAAAFIAKQQVVFS